MRRAIYLPEGCATPFPGGQPLSTLHEAMAAEAILTAVVTRCDKYRDLHVSLGGYHGIIPRSEAVHNAISGAERDIAVLSLVGRRIACTITGITTDGAGRPTLRLSRSAAQEQAMDWLMEHAPIGTVLPARVTHLTAFGAFVDLGCGVISLVPRDNLSVSRAEHPAQRLQIGQDILVLVTGRDKELRRFYLSCKELQGTWLQNAADFATGDTVPGIVRSIHEYGIFVELTPNLSGLAEYREGLCPGDGVGVYIRSIRPEGRKIKLQILHRLEDPPSIAPPRYFITDGPVEDWTY